VTKTCLIHGFVYEIISNFDLFHFEFTWIMLVGYCSGNRLGVNLNVCISDFHCLKYKIGIYMNKFFQNISNGLKIQFSDGFQFFQWMKTNLKWSIMHSNENSLLQIFSWIVMFHINKFKGAPVIDGSLVRSSV